MSLLEVDIGHGEGDSILNTTEIENSNSDTNGSEQNLNNVKESSEICCNDSELNLGGNLEYPTREQINENEQRLKDRINQFRQSVESLKEDLHIEKDKLNAESKIDLKPQILKYLPNYEKSQSENSFSSHHMESTMSNLFSYDQNMVEYEKQLQKYHDALTMAQFEKKNAIRKQMMAKAYKLKLLEVENQCNIELLRLKQNLQYLEPLKNLAQQWKMESNCSDSVKCDNVDDLCSLAELRTKSLLDFTDTSDKSSEFSQCNILDIIPCPSSLSSPRH